MKINYVHGNNEILYDMNTMKSILGVNKSKIQREIKKIPENQFVKYKNQHLYKETTLFILMENILFERLDKIESNQNEL